MPIGGPIVGPIAEHVSPRAAVANGGAAALVAAALRWHAYRTYESNPRRVDVAGGPHAISVTT